MCGNPRHYTLLPNTGIMTWATTHLHENYRVAFQNTIIWVCFFVEDSSSLLVGCMNMLYINRYCSTAKHIPLSNLCYKCPRNLRMLLQLLAHLPMCPLLVNEETTSIAFFLLAFSLPSFYSLEFACVFPLQFYILPFENLTTVHKTFC